MHVDIDVYLVCIIVCVTTSVQVSDIHRFSNGPDMKQSKIESTVNGVSCNIFQLVSTITCWLFKYLIVIAYIYSYKITFSYIFFWFFSFVFSLVLLFDYFIFVWLIVLDWKIKEEIKDIVLTIIVEINFFYLIIYNIY